MKKTFLLLTVISFLISTSAQAQVLRNVAKSAVNQAKNSAEDRATKEVNKEVDKGVNKFIDNLLGPDEQEEKPKSDEQKAPDEAAKNSQANVNRFIQRLGIETTEIPRKDLYKFNSEMIIITESTDYDGNKNAPIEFTICSNESNNDIMFSSNDQTKNQVSIIDNENKCFIVLTNDGGNKTGFATKYDSDAFKQTSNMLYQPGEGTEQATGDNEVINCEMAKTGSTKKISGFNCEEYKCENENEVQIAWITKDQALKLNKAFGQTPWGAGYAKSEFDGMVIQFETKSKTDKSSSVMTVKSINNTKMNSFSTTDYQISSLSLAIE